MVFLRSFRPRLTKIKALARVVSWADALSLSGTKTIDRAEVNVSLRMINRCVIIRPGTSDLRCLGKVFGDREYAIPFEINPRLIVDAGANIGLVTLYFSGKFPAAKIIAIEPLRGRFDGRMVLSRRDSTMVARHEVPGIIRKITPSQRDD